MQYFIIEKICENACKLIFMGDSFDSIGDYIRRLNRDCARTLYVTTESQVRNIFFNDCNQERIDKYWKEHAMKDTRTESPFLHMPLPSNFEEYLSDLNTSFLASNKVMDLG